jgi:hypothetical protein
MGQIVPEFADVPDPPREVLCDVFRIICRVDSDAVRIPFCVHASRELASVIDPHAWESI